ncbi:Rieske 2Fe-2S domain-containing protein [Methylobrevis pamukkalensis]|uniref:Rieske 2Fe-2S domain-containing protein n=1 Tax=Methylobrevis pamukkalensis TaxID=1439726 RepID=UPI003CCA3F24
MLGEQVVAFRDDEGVAIFKDLCIHRGAAFSAGGRAENGRIVCPYHAGPMTRPAPACTFPRSPPARRSRKRRAPSPTRPARPMVSSGSASPSRRCPSPNGRTMPGTGPTTG